MFNNFRRLAMIKNAAANINATPHRLALTTTLSLRYYAKFGQPYQGPPKLPKEEQEEFERLQQRAQTQIAIEEYNDQIRAQQAAQVQAQEEAAQVENTNAAANHKVNESGNENENENERPPPVVNPSGDSDIGSFAYLKIIPEFEGDVNPKTGERGGPKQDPLRNGEEWTYNGRTIDF
ncbi:hypothetical protein PVL30_000708 [Lodderomyces elongisporus]|uniref:uncharacterized protein n=1 Tax=Lodderomyces elongisporus TaxID=36914 RepID=UPI00291CB678|nr:uncharacterized protein PVL30_000708 [Lodderomyces elongisporus]WLF77000.1 hypothetical protein PVL30_000708 [Lodderomyces elongisporus]